ncbi:MAG: GNAT family N-acetyltransferase [Erysipelotrichaceae bacterium]|nr:GNAT family N-acetyltransferase [Erysipelotrichaceae bacterium]
MVELKEYQHEQDIAISLIGQFWYAHNQEAPSYEDNKENLVEWTKEGHKLYFITHQQQIVGFVHLGSRGCEMDWLEDIFVVPDYQNRGIGTQAIALVEQLVQTYSSSLYIEASSRNIAAIRLYHKLGYNCLNTITVRKDFNDGYRVVRKDTISDLEFIIKAK